MNPQEYLNSPLADSSTESDYRSDSDQLFNSKDPNLAILHEKPEHRLCIFLKVQGLTNREIAAKVGYTEPWVSQLLRQPWARTRIVHELQAAGRDIVQGLLATEAAESVYRLIELRDQDEEKGVARAAADSILDRFLGKPTQHVKTEQVKRTAGDIEAVDRELAELEREEKRLRGIVIATN